MSSPLQRGADRLGLRTTPAIFFGSAVVVIAFTAAMSLFPGPVQAGFGVVASWLRYDVGWIYTLSLTIIVTFLLALAFSRYGRVKLGDDDATPEYSGLTWFGMLFAAGVGAVLMFWGIAEPMNHYANPPMYGTEPFSDQAASEAMAIANFHFGIHMWAILLLPGLCFGYFTYKRKLPPRMSSAFQPLLGDRIHGPIGKVIDIIAVVSTVFGLAVSVGLGALQINAGMDYVFGTPVAGWVQALILAVITAVGLASVLAGMDRGVKRLSYANILLAIALLVYVLMWAVSSMDVVRGTVQAIGEYLSALPRLSTFNDTYRSGDWSGDWTVFYWAWTVTWAPFVGMFFARISRGRTIREFIVAGLGLPTAFVIVWMGVYGYSAFQSDRATAAGPGQGGELTQTIVTDGNVQAALFQHLQGMPLYLPVAVLALIVITLFFITSIDSGALVMDAMANGHEDPAPRRQSVFWSLSIGAVCAAIILTAGENGLAALQEVIIVIGLPILLITVMQAFLLLQALREDAGAAKPMRTRQWKKVLPTEEYHRRAQEEGQDIGEYVIRPEFEPGTEPEFDTHTPNTWHQQRTVAQRALVSIGLTGGSASGRTAVGEELERLGAVVVEFDDLMGDLLVPGAPVLGELRAVFGPEIVHADGTLDVAAMNRLTGESQTARARMYEIVAPVVRAEADRRAKAIGENAVLVVDLALLAETGSAKDFDQVLAVQAPAEARVERLMASHGMDRERAWAFIDEEAPDDERARIADVVLENTGSLEDLHAQVRTYWAERIQPVLDDAGTTARH
ncbi:dephospho-CoA kinase [Micrococcus sp.]|uniref:dephospho-CoA kinase n=1 Tax=Micrococcus sp. TaxID=1271 RepID=UPI002A90BC11|nr:dephospho-CoA kinase [Micrococcus sp.]MDY6054440.1 dephospho-CoA kinase [Micrococcus sp.]